MLHLITHPTELLAKMTLDSLLCMGTMPCSAASFIMDVHCLTFVVLCTLTMRGRTSDSVLPLKVTVRVTFARKACMELREESEHRVQATLLLNLDRCTCEARG